MAVLVIYNHKYSYAIGYVNKAEDFLLSAIRLSPDKPPKGIELQIRKSRVICA